MLDEILTKVGLKYQDLLPAEKETLNSWLSALQQNQITPERIKEHISSMKFAVEDELSRTGYNSKQDLLLKARLRNYLLLEAFLTTPEKAKQQLERTMAGLVSKK